MVTSYLAGSVLPGFFASFMTWCSRQKSLGFYCMKPWREPVPVSRFLHLLIEISFDQGCSSIYGDIDSVPCQVDYKQARRRIRKRSHLKLYVRNFSQVNPEQHGVAYCNMQAEDNLPFLREDFLILVPSVQWTWPSLRNLFTSGTVTCLLYKKLKLSFVLFWWIRWRTTWRLIWAIDHSRGRC